MITSRSAARSVLAILILASGPATAASVSAGRAAAGMCATCHGQNGIAVAPDAPNLAGMSPIYTAAQLKAFKSGARQHQQMSIIAEGLSDEEIADLAAWYAAIEITATPPAE
ncbi:cytochrome c [Fulvimarina sp. 2208YS6-2-32]|uniref:Cytochrome c n=1 Tax=Fulvimarina uroteuthidis TaxID=3098149 RepID=A0ABU5HXY8_9HYPH|nr:cytochrome c [Fulvimarina sp. 2208YS6-2-32]MDY8108002.1 cytochrome c [Fulvimarina sp. 2208YS6-2-32]